MEYHPSHSSYMQDTTEGINGYGNGAQGRLMGILFLKSFIAKPAISVLHHVLIFEDMVRISYH
jgi:hypothetical protein